MVKLLLFILAPVYLNASLIISGQGPLGVFADANLAIPADPLNTPIPRMKRFVQASWSGTITVLFDSGSSGYLDFNITAMATPFGGGSSGEYMDSWSAISAPWSLVTPGFNPEGSTPMYATERLPFTAGAAQHVTFTAAADSSYVYGAYIPADFPVFAGRTIYSSLSISSPWIEGGYSGTVIFAQDDPADPPVPESSSVWLMISGLVVVGVMNRRTGCRRGLRQVGVR